MSTILKALRRLEEEKQSGADRPLREEVATGGPVAAAEPPKRRGAVVGLLIGLWLLTVGVLVYTQWHRIEAQWVVAREAAQESQQAQQEVPPEREGIAQAPSAQAAAGPSPALPREQADALAARYEELATEDAMPAEAYASDVEVVRRPFPAPRSPIEYARASDPAQPQAGSSRLEAEPVAEEPTPTPTAPPVARAPESEPEPVAPSPRPEPPPVAASPRPAPKAPVAAPPAPEPEPAPKVVARSEPPAPPEPAKPASGSDLRVERTQWHPSASRRVAFVALGDADARRVEEGDRVGDYVVSEIEVTGVVFLRDGSLITRKVGSK